MSKYRPNINGRCSVPSSAINLDHVAKNAHSRINRLALSDVFSSGVTVMFMEKRVSVSMPNAVQTGPTHERECSFPASHRKIPNWRRSHGPIQVPTKSAKPLRAMYIGEPILIHMQQCKTPFFLCPVAKSESVPSVYNDCYYFPA